MKQLEDIETEEDIIVLVDNFYSKATNDSAIGYIFSEHMKVTMEEHLPMIYKFWQSVLLGTMIYRGQVMATHIDLHRRVKLTEAHFERWLRLWNETVDALHVGEKAEETKQRAAAMKDLMLFKILGSENSSFIQ